MQVRRLAARGNPGGRHSAVMGRNNGRLDLWQLPENQWVFYSTDVLFYWAKSQNHFAGGIIFEPEFYERS
jgi:hypothetical protein